MRRSLNHARRVVLTAATATRVIAARSLSSQTARSADHAAAAGRAPAGQSACDAALAGLPTAVKSPSGKAPSVVCGISGGVDSSVSAYLLKQQGYNVTGVFMKNWDELDETGVCTGEADRRDAELVCRKLGIPFAEVDFTKEYWSAVFERVLRGLAAGYTPNPDVLCNRDIKFRAFLRHATERLGADFVATGHYARVSRHAPAGSAGPAKLVTAADALKDQTYFLALSHGGAFDRALFPVGHLLKPQVRAVATELSLLTATKRDSQGMCFIGKRNFADFVGQYLEMQPGPVRSLLDGAELGRHAGLPRFTLGQSAQLGGMRDRWFVAGKDPASNALLVVPGTHHPALYTRSLRTREVSWLSGAPPAALLRPDGSLRCLVRIRHNAPLAKATIRIVPDSAAASSSAGAAASAALRVDREALRSELSARAGADIASPASASTGSRSKSGSIASGGAAGRSGAGPASPSVAALGAAAIGDARSTVDALSDFDTRIEYEVAFDEPERGPCVGQAAVFYDERGWECLGGGVINAVGLSLHALGQPLPEGVVQRQSQHLQHSRAQREQRRLR